MAEIRIERKSRGLGWLWLLLALVIVAALAWYFLYPGRPAPPPAPAPATTGALDPGVAAGEGLVALVRASDPRLAVAGGSYGEKG